MNNNTRRYPRTLEEAFGPHVSRDIQEPETKADRRRVRWIAVTCAAILLCVGVLASGKATYIITNTLMTIGGFAVVAYVADWTVKALARAIDWLSGDSF
jgi:hypothetical protein